MLFIIDFDGTVAPTDTVDALLERFADPEWRRIEERWVAGEINSQECMAAQLALVRGSRAVLEAFLQSVIVDPFFPEFVREASRLGELAIVSDGLDHPIRHAMRTIGATVPIFANHLIFSGDSLALSFPYRDAACKVKSGVCKCAVTRAIDAGRGLPTVLIGDGHSDRCIARCVDYVFAKGSLRTFCEAENIAHTPFQSFSDVLSTIRRWTARSNREGALELICPLSTA